ncbi:MAG: hypothetical protein J4F41_10345 [Alphaproteobacteria bacterium]|nr:hypothetical protein [Alphaproteobacteria bacterium]
MKNPLKLTLRSTEDRQRRLMGPLLDIFTFLEGKRWATAIGAVAITTLIVMSFLPQS